MVDAAGPEGRGVVPAARSREHRLLVALQGYVQETEVALAMVVSVAEETVARLGSDGEHLRRRLEDAVAARSGVAAARQALMEAIAGAGDGGDPSSSEAEPRWPRG